MTKASTPKLATQDDIHLAVGRALGAWEMLEHELSLIFSAVVGTQSIAAVRAYGAVANFHARADMLQAAAEAYFRYGGKGDHEKRLRALLKEARNQAPRRNEIAHGLAIWAFKQGKDTGWKLCPGWYNSRKIKLPMAWAYEYAPEDINAIRHVFQELMLQAQRLYLDVIEHKSSLDRQLQQRRAKNQAPLPGPRSKRKP